MPCAASTPAVPRVAIRRNPSLSSARATCTTASLSPSRTLMNAVPVSGSFAPAASCDLTKASPKVFPTPITSPVDTILGPEMKSTPGNFTNGNTASFTEKYPGTTSASAPCCARVFPTMQRAAILASGTPVALPTKGTVREARGLTSGLLNMLHDSADENVFAVAGGVHVHLRGIGEEPVEQHRRIVRNFDGLAHVALEILLLVHDLHRAPAEHVARTHHQRIADFLRETQRIGFSARRAVGRLLEPEAIDELLEALAVFGHVDHVGRGADDRHSVRLEIPGELQRRLTAELDDHAVGFFLVDDLEDVLQRKRLEIEAVGGIVVGRDRFRVAVDHDRLEAVFAQRERRVHAAVVELDALSDAIRSAPQDDHLFPIGGRRLALLLVSGVHVRGPRREFRRAGIDSLVRRADSEAMPRSAHFRLARVEQVGKPPVGETLALEHAQHWRIHFREPLVVELHFEIDDLLDLREEPGIDMRELVHLFQRESVLERIAHVPDALRSRFAQLLFYFFAVG